jgi:predicted NACHT family NTPase
MTLLSSLTGGITGAIAALAISIIAPDIFKLMLKLSKYRGKPMADISLDTALDFVETLSRQHREGQGLSDGERAIFQGIWEGKRFKEIAQAYRKAGLEHLQRNVAPKLYKFLSEATGEKVVASTLKSAINRAYARAQEEPDIEALVKTVRSKGAKRIRRECGTMRVLDMNQPIDLDDIYTEVNILEKVASKTWAELDILLKDCQRKNFDRPDYRAIQKSRVPALEAVENYQNLFVLGKPGAGKTTFSKHLAIQCNSGKFKPELVPVFITLREFAVDEGQPGLLTYIQKRMQGDRVTAEEVETILHHGKVFLLLDGLDEVKKEASQRLIDQVREFLQMFPDNRCVMTCRIAAQEYIFPEFTIVEVADFSEEQIKSFAKKWFTARFPAEAEDLISKFHDKLNANKPSKELASNPLLLTLLCLVFEDLKAFPQKRSQLYKDGLELLLKRWDNKRNIERPELYKDLDTPQKEDLLSYLAYTTFTQGRLFFEQEEIEGHIVEYIRSLPDAQTDAKQLRLDSTAVLKGIEAQHGILVERAQHIYSFSHLTFQEYFTARQIVNSPSPDALEKAFDTLVNQIGNKQWREVFLLTVEMLPNADYLLKLMKQKVDAIAAGDEDIQKLLVWLKEKTDSIEHPYKPAAVRANYMEPALDGYLPHFLCENRGLPYGISIDIWLKLDLGTALNQNLQDPSVIKKFEGLDYGLDRTIDEKFDRDLYFPFKPGQVEDRNNFFANAQNRDRSTILNNSLVTLEKNDRDPELKEALQKLKSQLPSSSDSAALEQWFHQDEGKAWTEQLRTVMIQYRNVGHDWQFSDAQYQLLKDYYNSNLLLVQCLQQSRYVSLEVRQEIEATLLLPQAELEQG